MTDYLAEAHLIAQRALTEPLFPVRTAQPRPVARNLPEIEQSVSDADILLQTLQRQMADMAAEGVRHATIACVILPNLMTAMRQLAAAIIALDALGAS